MLLENENSVVYGVGGSVGSAVARAFAREGAKVFLTGRTLGMLDEVAEEIHCAGGVVETARRMDTAHSGLAQTQTTSIGEKR
jgi:NADP-dependent 3-hydroxy acid dehydrogenase YdfG